MNLFISPGAKLDFYNLNHDARFKVLRWLFNKGFSIARVFTASRRSRSLPINHVLQFPFLHCFMHRKQFTEGQDSKVCITLRNTHFTR